MDVFALRQSLIDEYAAFARSFTSIRADDIRTQVDAAYAGGRYWPEPLIQINPRFQLGRPVSELAANGDVERRCAELFPIGLYSHQERAIALAAAGKSFVVTTGTGSGKSLCFFLPIVDAVLRERATDPSPRTRAIIIYPMNALANSQVEELRKFLGEAGPVTFARYTGQEGADERERIRRNPPDILLTNFMMLELLMTRQEELDRQVIANCQDLRFLVLDELHTYRGRQGADVAMLVRRVRERLAPTRLQCIGTSATMASTGSLESRATVVAEVVTRLFATPVQAFDIVTEDLERATDARETAETVRPALGAAIDGIDSTSMSNADLRTHPLAVWIETRLGIVRPEGKWVRARPLTVTEAVEQLSADANREPVVVRRVLQQFLLRAAQPESDRTGGAGGPFFAFKLHQFVSGAGVAYSTLDPPAERRVVLEGQQYLPGDPSRRLYPTYFCRSCGQEYHPVRLRGGADTGVVLPRDIDDMPTRRADADEAEDAAEDAEAERLGFLLPRPDDPEFTFDGKPEDYPETWLTSNRAGETRLRPELRSLMAQRLRVATDGRVGDGRDAFFLPGKFRFCPHCGDTHGAQGKDINRLASLSAEGRSSATTMLTSSALRWMHRNQAPPLPHQRKLLGFTDNRQDAALQSGHFNDFTFVTLIRSAMHRALADAGATGLVDSGLGDALIAALGFDDAIVPGTNPADSHRREWMQDPSMTGVDLETARNRLRQVLAYRAWFDQRRGWRFTNPNLEQLGLLGVEYTDLDAFCGNDAAFVEAPPLLRSASAEARRTAFTELFDHMRRGLAVDAAALDAQSLEPLREDALRLLRQPWGIGRDERLRGSRWLLVVPPHRARIRGADEELLLRAGPQTPLGRSLRSRALWNDAAASRQTRDDYQKLLEAMLLLAQRNGFVRRSEQTPFQVPGFRLNSLRVRFRLAAPRNPQSANPFFTSLYATVGEMLRARGHVLFDLEAREHTAQVDAQLRELREMRFRYGESERAELAGPRREQLAKLGESERFLPLIVCSPTMELGVDISALNSVYLRNVPPTPANYVQRAGRAGRHGQAALVVTYCAAQSPHDQYFFREPRAMVHGEVRAPVLDLANRELIQSHLQAVWLACSGAPLAPSIAEIVDPTIPGMPVRAPLANALQAPGVAQAAVERCTHILAMLASELTPRSAPWFGTVEGLVAQVAGEAYDHFDRAFHRWRDLFRSAVRQRDLARATLDNFAITDPRERGDAQRRQRQALDQIDLLLRGDRGQSSDFYTYRYLATEGFLPGYNFPRLPLMAYIPGVAESRWGQVFLQRPRFLALAEFGPRSLVYHEGRAYKVVRARIAISSAEQANAGGLLPTQSARICRECGAAHFGDERNDCHACGASLADAQPVNGLYRIENVDTEPTERITANDEDRQRQGFDLQTVFQWATRVGQPDVRTLATNDANGPIVSFRYGPGATVTRINKGLRRRKSRSVMGFEIDPRTGKWASQADDDEAQGPDTPQTQRIVPYVQDQKNALLLQPAQPLDETTLVTVQHALKRGIEATFQLEESELLGESLPDPRDRKGVLYYEAAEGGAGVLTRLVSEPDAMARVARAALRIMHLEVPEDPGTPLPEVERLADVAGTTCVAGCYRCLLSYYNQPDHEQIDRRDIEARRLLWRLAQVEAELLAPPAPASVAREDAGTPVGWPATWVAQAARSAPALPAPAKAQADADTVILHWPDHYTAVGLPDTPREVQSAWEDRGYTFVRFVGDPATWGPAFGRLARLLGVPTQGNP